METTLNILNERLYALVDPEASVLAWVRNIVANRVSTCADDWVKVFSRYNSGT